MGIPIIGGPWHGALYFGGSPSKPTYPVKTFPNGVYWIVEIEEAAVMHWVPNGQNLRIHGPARKEM